MGTWLRHPKTTQERRQWHECEELLREYGSSIHIRRCRSFAWLPEAWDDIPRQDVDDRSWKRHRDHQYKMKKAREKKPSKKFGEHMARRDHSHLELRRHWLCWFSPCPQCVKNGTVWVMPGDMVYWD